MNTIAMVVGYLVIGYLVCGLVAFVWGLVTKKAEFTRDDFVDSLIAGPVGLFALVVNALQGGNPKL